jgi:hypothetical protein
MSFIDWISMNMFVDIACVVFFAASTWKIRKIEKCLNEVRSDLHVVMKNPQAARRLLKERK